MSVKEEITRKMRDAFAPVELEVVDDSARHAGHFTNPARGSGAGETHFNVHVVSEAFRGKSRIDRHRMVNALLADELAAGVHALAITARAPGEG